MLLIITITCPNCGQKNEKVHTSRKIVDNSIGQITCECGLEIPYEVEYEYE